MSMPPRIIRPSGQLAWGTVIHQVGRGGRIWLTDGFARCLGTPFVMTRAAGGGIVAMSEHRWKATMRLHENADFLGFYASSALRSTWRSHPFGRCHMPEHLLEHAGLYPGRSVALVGLGRAVILCRPETWEARVREFEMRILTLCDACGNVRGVPLAERVPSRVTKKAA